VSVLPWENAPDGVRVVFATRKGGVSAGPFRSRNLGLITDDEPDNVVENRTRLCAELGVDPAAGSMAHQVHGADVEEAEPLGLAAPGTRYPACDGLVTSEAGRPLMLVTADCLPVALARTDGTRLAVLHAGWRGLLADVVAEGVKAVGGPVTAAVGPGIGPCCYEVGDEVAGPFRERFGAGVVAGGKLDLAGAAEQALRTAGAETVERVALCTSCEDDLFFSHRRDRGVTGRQGIVAALG
jgi:YfiH family protein